jgi:hypothetical protein
MSNVSSLVPVHVAWDGGRLGLKLFDKSGQLYALSGSRSSVGRDFEGKWIAKRDRAPDPTVNGVGAESEERLAVSIMGTDTVSVTHQFKMRRVADNAHALFACNKKPAIASDGTQTLSGRLHNGVVTGSSTRIDATNDGCKQCGLCMTPHKLFVMKIRAGKLFLYRTNGTAAPEAMEFVRE